MRDRDTGSPWRSSALPGSDEGSHHRSEGRVRKRVQRSHSAARRWPVGRCGRWLARAIVGRCLLPKETGHGTTYRTDNWRPRTSHEHLSPAGHGPGSRSRSGSSTFFAPATCSWAWASRWSSGRCSSRASSGAFSKEPSSASSWRCPSWRCSACDIPCGCCRSCCSRSPGSSPGSRLSHSRCGRTGTWTRRRARGRAPGRLWLLRGRCRRRGRGP